MLRTHEIKLIERLEKGITSFNRTTNSPLPIDHTMNNSYAFYATIGMELSH